MQFTASSITEAVEFMASATGSRQRITAFDLSPLNRIIEYTPEDMTVTVEAGTTLSALQQALALRNQWLPIDPPHPETLAIGALLAANKSGPRRYGYGTIRDYLLGVKVVLADGRVIRAGGKVVKNVAGYDLCKLFVGSHGTLGVIVEATFKVLPRPETEQFVTATGGDMNDFLARLGSSTLTPVVLDAYGDAGQSSLVVGFAGTSEDVNWQLQRAGELGFTETASLDHEQRFWISTAEARCISVLPSKVIQAIAELGAETFVARAGNGVIYYRGGRAPAKPIVPQPLTRRIKEAYDPKGVLPDLPW